MATVNKDFKIKNGLVVEGATGTINGSNILTEASTEFLQDTSAAILTSGSHSGITFTYDDNTGVVNASVSSNPTFEGSITFEGATADAYETTLQITDPTADRTVTIPDATGTIVLRDTTDTLTNKSVSLASNTLTGTIAEFNTALTDADFATLAGTETLSNKTISYVDNTITVQVNNVSDLTASASELNTLDGITASTAELNILDGVTADYTEINVLDGITASTAELNTLDGITASTAELNLLDGATLSTTELNYVDGVTSSIQNQLDDKAPLASPALTGTPTAPTATAGNNSTQIATTQYVDTAVANLVDGAPALLDTLNELAAAINDDASFASTIGTSIGEKVAKSGDTMTGALTLNADPVNNLHAATKQYVDAAQSAAEDYADGLAGNYETSGAVSTHAGLTSTHGVTGDIVGTSDSQTLTNKTIDGSSNTLSNIANASLVNDSITINGSSTALGSSVTLDTDDVSEGTTNKYFTDDRAKDAAGYILENAVQTNISITYDEGTRQLTVTAENGVDDSDTDDLAEGTSNLYFTDQRAVDALEAVVPNFTEVDLNSVATQIAATTSVATASTVTAYSFAKADYRSGKFLVKAETSSHTEVSEILVTLDGSDNVAITEYAIVGTNGNLVNVTADVDGANVRIRTTTINNNTDVTVVGTLIA